MTIPLHGTQANPQAVLNSLTAQKAQPTKESPINTPVWARWFNLEPHDAQIESLIQIGANYALDFKERLTPRWLTIMGNSGNGKTHSADRLWEYMKNRSDWGACAHIPSKIYWPDFVEELRSQNAYEKYRDIMKWPVLLLDDVFSERDKEGFSVEKLNTLLGVREGRWTIITTNKTMRDIAQVEPRIADRIIRKPNRFIEVNTQSHALRKAVSLPYKD